MYKRTKIIATVGPATASLEQLQLLAQRGVNVIRFNFSHADYTSAQEIANRIHSINQESPGTLALLLDTKGPELRTGDVAGKIPFARGQKFRIYSVLPDTDERSLFCDYPYLAEDVDVGGIIEIDSGLFHVKVLSKGKDYVEVEALNDAIIGSRRHVNLPGVKIRLPGITEKDKQDILFGIKNGYHYIAASFIRTADNVAEIRDFLAENHASHIKVISKIENQEGIENLESIVKASDGVMVARGDLGIEIPIEKVPRYQKNIIDLCRHEGKFVIVATHMLESMIEHPFPTRAEVSDVFRAVLQGADATMLSGETTTGKYPLEAVEMMSKVIHEAEEELEHKHHEYSHFGLTVRDIEKKYLIRSALHIAEELGITKVLLFTKSGRLARLAAAYRPNIEIHAFSGDIQTVGTMQLLYAITPHFIPDWADHPTNLEKAILSLVSHSTVQATDRVIAVTDILKGTHEVPVLEVITIADILT